MFRSFNKPRARSKPMSDTRLDIIQRIVEVTQRTSDPKLNDCIAFEPETDTIIGEVPMHLRHVHNLLVDLINEVDDAMQQVYEAKKRLEAVRELYFDALEQQVPSGDYDVKICSEWKVVGYRRTTSEDGVEDLTRLMATM